MSENGLNILMKRIINSDYISMEELVRDSDTYSINEIHVFLDHIIAKWVANELTPAATNALFKFVHLYIDQPNIKIKYINQNALPICYFTPYLPVCASFLYSFLKTLFFAVELFPLSKTDQDLKEYTEKTKPPVIIFSISHFIHVELLKRLVSYSRNQDLKIVIGGIPFIYDESLKQGFPDCLFPKDLTELTLSLENCYKRDAR